MSEKDLKSYIKSYYLDRKMTYTKLDKHDRAIGVLLEENKQLKETLKDIEELLLSEEQPVQPCNIRYDILEIIKKALGDKENE